jgi:hypothetical protein
LVEFSQLVFLGSCRITQIQDAQSTSTVRHFRRASVQSAHEKTKQGLCSDPFCKPLRPVASTMCHGSACDDVVARAATSRILLDADTL